VDILFEGLSEEDLPRLSRNETNEPWIIDKFNEVFDRNSGVYYQMKLDGHKALCISPGLKARSGDVYEYLGSTSKPNYVMAIGFYLSNDYKGQEVYKWAIAQYVAWNGWHEDPEHAHYRQLILNDAKLEMFYPGFDRTAANRQKVIDVGKMLKKHLGKTYYIWKNRTRGSEGQLMVTDLPGCNEPTPENACPTGKMVKTNDNPVCYSSKGGNTFTNYEYLAIRGENTNVSVASESGAVGEELREIGSFCKLYCQEYGVATLPGAIGESLTLGSYMIWPTSDDNYNDKFYKGYYPLKFNGTLKCKIGIIPDEGLPFACKRDPIEDEYRPAYNYVNSNKTTGTYKRIKNTTLEKMRLAITTWGASDSMPSPGTIKSACTKAHNEDARAKDFEYDEAERKMNDALSAYNVAQSAVNNFTGTKYQKVCKTMVGPQCIQYVDGAPTTAYAIVLAERDSKKAIYEAKKEIFESIKESRDNCITYTTKFEIARQTLKDYKLCAEFEADESLYPFSSSVSFNYSDKQYNIGDVTNSKSVVTQLDGVAGQFELFPDSIKDNKFEADDLIAFYPVTEVTDKVNEIKAREITIGKEDTYELFTGYKYVDKESKKYLINPPSNANYSTINTSNGIIPTSYDNEIAKDYYMTLSGISFGMAGFGINDNGTSTRYVCPVQFTKVSNTTCVCPEGTKMAGKDIIGLIADNKMTCADAQLLYCDSDEDIPHEDMYCPNMPEISIGACVNSGYTKSECISKLCNERYTCKNTNGVSGKMDITSCVQTKMMQGLTRQQAIDYCDAVVCPIGRTIIYRTIRLENPFPSYDQSQNPYNGLSTGMFNNNTRGRYPGYNWNGILTVYNKIRNNRSGRLEKNESTAINKNTTIGTTIYQTKEPLYTFVLDGGTIREIRRYNESRVDGYNDFNSSKENNNMDCKINNSIACVSAFVHDPSGKYGLTGGVCKDSDGKDSFYKCARR